MRVERLAEGGAKDAAPGRRILHDLALVALVAAALRLGLGLLSTPQPAWDGVIYVRAAEALARGEGYTQRALSDMAPARPSAFYPVGQSAIFAVVRALGGGLVADLLVQAAFGVLSALATYLAALRLGGRRGARWAAWLVACWPGGVLLSASWLSEPAFTCLLTFALTSLLVARAPSRYLARACAALCLGIAAYLRPTALPIAFALFSLDGYLHARGSVTQRLLGAARSVGLAALLIGALLAPWVWRNVRTLGHPVLVSTNGGANLLVGAIGNGLYRPIPAELDCPPGQHEIARDACRRDRALAIIREAPTGAVLRGMGKLFFTFSYEATPMEQYADAVGGLSAPTRMIGAAISTAYYLALLALALRAWREGRRRARLRAASTLVFGATLAVAALHAVVLGGDRYHLPLVPLFAILAGVSLRSGRSHSRAAR